LGKLPNRHGVCCGALGPLMAQLRQATDIALCTAASRLKLTFSRNEFEF
jgi:hypothetical protein